MAFNALANPSYYKSNREHYYRVKSVGRYPNVGAITSEPLRYYAVDCNLPHGATEINFYLTDFVIKSESDYLITNPELKAVKRAIIMKELSDSRSLRYLTHRNGKEVLSKDYLPDGHKACTRNLYITARVSHLTFVLNGNTHTRHHNELNGNAKRPARDSVHLIVAVASVNHATLQTDNCGPPYDRRSSCRTSTGVNDRWFSPGDRFFFLETIATMYSGIGLGRDLMEWLERMYREVYGFKGAALRATVDPYSFYVHMGYQSHSLFDGCTFPTEMHKPMRTFLQDSANYGYLLMKKFS